MPWQKNNYNNSMKITSFSHFLSLSLSCFFFFADKARDFIEKWHLDGELEGKGTQEDLVVFKCTIQWLFVHSQGCASITAI